MAKESKTQGVLPSDGLTTKCMLFLLNDAENRESSVRKWSEELKKRIITRDKLSHQEKVALEKRSARQLEKIAERWMHIPDTNHIVLKKT